MAGHARYTALLDACVLYPLATADALISLASVGLFAAKWTSKIEGEWISNLEANRTDLKGKLFTRCDLMREAVPDWEVQEEAWHLCSSGLALPDPKDVHVLAAALAGHADCIVTANLRDFPNAVLKPLGIEAIHPDQFLVAQWDLDPLTAVAAFKKMRSRRKKPEESAEQFAAAFERHALPTIADRLRDAAELL